MRGWRPNLLQLGLLLLIAGAAGAIFYWAPLASHQAQGFLYVSEPTLDRVSVINLSTGKLQHRYPLGRLPHQLLSGPDGRIYVLETGSQSLSILPSSPDGGGVFQRMIGTAPDNLPHRALGAPALARATSCKTCHQGSIQGSLPGSMALTRDQSKLWITELRAKRLSLVTVNALETQEQLGLLGDESSPTKLLVHPKTGDTYVISRTYKGAVPKSGGIGEFGLRISLDPEHAGSLGTSSLTVGDAQMNTIKGRLAIPWAGAGAGVFSADGNKLYLTCRGANRLAVIGLNPLQILGSIDTAPAPAALAWVTPNVLAIASLSTNPGVLQFFNTERHEIEHRTTVGANPACLAFDAHHRRLYVGCTGNATVAEVNVVSREVEREFKLEGHPGGLAITPPSSTRSAL